MKSTNLPDIMKIKNWLLLNLNLSSSYVQAMWKTRLRIPIKIHGIKVRAWKVSQRIKGTLFRRTYESDEIKMIQKVIQADERVLELGGGLGVTTSLMAMIVFPTPVWTFEANPHTYELMRGNLALNKIHNVQAINAVVGQEAGEVDFYVSKDFWEASLIPLPESKRIVVPVHSLTEVLNEVLPTTVVIDIEGAEYELLLLKSWRDTPSIKRIIVEFHKFSAEQSQSEKLARIYKLFTIDFELIEAIELLKEGHLTLVLNT